jgi:hypothetical protein
VIAPQISNKLRDCRPRVLCSNGIHFVAEEELAIAGVGETWLCVTFERLVERSLKEQY